MRDLKPFFLVSSSVILVIIALFLADKVTGQAVDREQKAEVVLPEPQDKLDFLFDFLNTAQDVLDNGSDEQEAMARAAVQVMYDYVTTRLPDKAIDIFYMDSPK